VALVESADGRREIDDIGVIALTPDVQNDTSTGTIIMGGTRPGVKTAFAQCDGRKIALDRWDTTAA
jgi:hypothetical protein